MVVYRQMGKKRKTLKHNHSTTNNNNNNNNHSAHEFPGVTCGTTALRRVREFWFVHDPHEGRDQRSTFDFNAPSWQVRTYHQ
jgi:hypothetical protein